MASAAVAWLHGFEALAEVFAGVSVVAEQVWGGVEADEGGLAAGVGEKAVKERTQVAELVEFEGAHAALLDGHDEGDGRGVHLFLDADLLRNDIVVEDEIVGVEAGDNA